MCYRTGEGNHDCSLVLISSVEATANCYWRCTVHQCTVVQVLENAFNTSVANSSVWNAIVANCEGALVSTSHFDTREHDPSLHRLAALLLLGDVVHFNCNAHCVTVVHCAVIVYRYTVLCEGSVDRAWRWHVGSKPAFFSLKTIVILLFRLIVKIIIRIAIFLMIKAMFMLSVLIAPHETAVG